MSVFLSLAILPGLFIVYYIYKLDRIEKEPLSLLMKLFILGALSVISAILFESISLTALANILPAGSIIYIFFECLFVGLIEEGGKYVALYVGSWKNKAFNYVFDGIVYAVCVSLGFAILENVMYGIEYGTSTLMVRAISAIPFHAIFSIFMGQFYGLAKYESVYRDGAKKNKNLSLALIVPMGIHALYDFGASIPGFEILFFVVVLIAEWACFKKIKALAIQDKPI